MKASVPPPLDYRSNANDVVQIRFKLENCTYAPDASSSAVDFYYKADGILLNQSPAYVRQSVDEKWVFSGEYYVMNMELPDQFTQANVIDAIRPQFANIRAIEGAEGRILIDYIYVGPQETAPQTFAAQRFIEAVDTTGENFRLTYNIDVFTPLGYVRFREILTEEFEWYDPSDNTTGKNAIKVYKAPYLGNGKYSTTLTRMTSGYTFVKFDTDSGKEKTINLRVTDMTGAYRRDNDIEGYRYVVQINFRVDHDYTVGGNGIMPFDNRQITYEIPNSTEIVGGLYFEAETLNTALITPRAYDFFMELYNEENAAAKTDMTEKGRAFDLVEASQMSVADRNYIIFMNMFDNYALMRDTTYAGVKYVIHRIERNDTTGEISNYATHYAVTYPAGSTTFSSESKYGNAPFELKSDAEFRTRILFTPTVTTSDTLGRAAQPAGTWTEAHSYYYAPKFAVVDYGRTVSLNMQHEGQQIGTWKDPDPEERDKGVQLDYGFHVLSTNGQIDRYLSNIKFNCRKRFLHNGSLFLLEEPAEIYYLTRSRAGEKGQTKRTIASFESEVAALHEGTGVAYDMNLDQYYDIKQNSITYTFGDANESPKALEGSYYTTLRKVTIIPANNIYYDIDKFKLENDNKEWGEEPVGSQTSGLQVHDYDDDYASPFGYDQQCHHHHRLYLHRTRPLNG